MGPANIIEILNALHLHPDAWPGPIAHDGVIHPSVKSLLAHTQSTGEAPPSWVYATRTSRVAPDAAHIVLYLFPDGVPDLTAIPAETATAISNLIRAAEVLAEAPGMERIVPDTEKAIILNKYEFEKMLIAETGN